ncbi:MAG: tRNA preQ1(34) S-adenosylmethionine ribosyltransferase-isomerase QueA [Planctomycetales bacterium]|nr:tRNA preQ1(34) S-adenosylmethionine ribosyltransferase-isomerase QueA [Planctomycetales bacterium]MCA9170209.1 tRNA preQ1(34) S-adenosylmethionine ribosyltransferase-isomerase QueA [Planctomycetales bacterium]
MSEVDQYDYELPKELIAQQPVAHRVDARLMVVRRAAGEIEHAHIRDLPDILRPGDVLVANDSRVVPARLIGTRESTGGRWQGLFLTADENGVWQLLSKTRGKLVTGERIVLLDRLSRPAVKLRMLTQLAGGAWAARPESAASCWDLLAEVGRVPLPPYIRGGEMVEHDLDWYQTVYADRPGSVAAPTAGLHLTTGLIERLERHGVSMERVTLHVGMGTFRPISATSLDEHEMHSEWGELSSAVAARLSAARSSGRRLIAVGTTSVRVLESAAQQVGPLQPWSGETRLFIRPPYRFQTVDGLLTNFHLPKSTLLVLVRTFGGDDLLREAYAQAVQERYRFFSYGDAMLIL